MPLTKADQDVEDQIQALVQEKAVYLSKNRAALKKLTDQRDKKVLVISAEEQVIAMSEEEKAAMSAAIKGSN